uniref:helix-turn-helix domain-containing protein n=1 Tax=Mesorhizobium sp. LHD-90 TaxID=3071414 RepID=UPI0035A992D2
MQKFRDVLSRWDRGDLSLLEAGELLGMSERQFRRYRDRYEESGDAGLLDRWLGNVSGRRAAAAAVEEMLWLYRERYRGWNVKHFHEHLVRDHNFSWGYTFTKTRLHAAGLVERSKRRGAHRRKPCAGEARAARSGCSPRCMTGCRKSWRLPASARSTRPTASSHRPTCRRIIPASPARVNRFDATTEADK